MQQPLQNLLDFVSFTHEIRKVKRAMWVKDEEQFENDSEHGYQLAMVAMYIIENDNLELDVYRAMALALVHDVLEVHAGDTFAYGAATSSQHEREVVAVRMLKQQWPNQTLMLGLIDEYESKGSPEAKFIYALDKLVPILNNVLDNGRNWRHERITLDQLIEVKSKKISVDGDVQRYYERVLELLRARPELFEAAG